MNAEIVQRLEKSLGSGTILGDLMDEIASKIAPRDAEEQAILKIVRALTDKERYILRSLLSGIIEARESE